MSDTTKAPTLPPLPSIVVKRNEIDLEFKSNTVTRGDNKGWQYLAPEVTAENVDSVVGWMDRKTAAKKLGGVLKQYSQGWYADAEEEATDTETGQVDKDKLVEVFGKLASDFSARGESIPELKGQIDELVELMTNLNPTDADFGTKFQSYAQEVKDLQLAISMQRRKPRKSATEAATK
jgi:hypothetical protein